METQVEVELATLIFISQHCETFELTLEAMKYIVTKNMNFQ